MGKVVIEDVKGRANQTMMIGDSCRQGIGDFLTGEELTMLFKFAVRNVSVRND